MLDSKSKEKTELCSEENTTMDAKAEKMSHYLPTE